MKRFIIFTVSLLIIGWLNGECQNLSVECKGYACKVMSAGDSVLLTMHEVETMITRLEMYCSEGTQIDYFEDNLYDLFGKRYSYHIKYNQEFCLLKIYRFGLSRKMYRNFSEDCSIWINDPCELRDILISSRRIPYEE